MKFKDRVAILTRAGSSEASANPLVSIIVTSYATERLRHIVDLLDSVKIQTYPNVETIFVVERSVDLLKRIRAYVDVKGIPNVHIIFNPSEVGACFGRNIGIGEAKGDILALIDDDVILFPDWAEEMVKSYRDLSVIGVTGPVFPLWEDESMEWFPEEFDWIFSCARWFGRMKRPVRNINGPNGSFRREAFDAAGLYSPVLGSKKVKNISEWNSFGEEAELCLRVTKRTGKRIIYNPQVRVYHKVPQGKFRWGFIIQRSYQVGHTRRALKELYAAEEREGKLLAEEHDLLRRIVGRLTPRILKDAFSNPLTAWRNFLVITISLFFVMLGYLTPFSRSVSRKTS